MLKREAVLSCRGVALVTALLVSVFLVVVGAAFLAFVSNDYYFAGKEQNNAEVFYLAKAGMQYYAGAGIPSGGKINIPANDSRHFCVISQDGTTGDLTFTGTIKDYFGNVLARRTIRAPGGSLGQWYEAGQ